jgi:hypothetical protein
MGALQTSAILRRALIEFFESVLESEWPLKERLNLDERLSKHLPFSDTYSRGSGSGFWSHIEDGQETPTAIRPYPRACRRGRKNYSATPFL